MHTVIRDHSLKYDRRGEHNYQKAFRPDPLPIINERGPAYNCRHLTFQLLFNFQHLVRNFLFFEARSKRLKNNQKLVHFFTYSFYWQG